MGLKPSVSQHFTGLPIEMDRGDLLCFTQLTPHGAMPNLTETVRWSIDMRFSAVGDSNPVEYSFVVRSVDPDKITPYETWRSWWGVSNWGAY